MRNLKLIAASLLLLLLAGATAAEAHAFLDSAEPAVGSVIKQAPAQIKLHFSEGIEAKFSGAELHDAADKAVAVNMSVDAANNKVLMVTPQAPLQAGTYHVLWHITSVDSHKTKGSFNFTVAP